MQADDNRKPNNLVPNDPIAQTGESILTEGEFLRLFQHIITEIYSAYA